MKEQKRKVMTKKAKKDQKGHKWENYDSGIKKT